MRSPMLNGEFYGCLFLAFHFPESDGFLLVMPHDMLLGTGHKTLGDSEEETGEISRSFGSITTM